VSNVTNIKSRSMSKLSKSVVRLQIGLVVWPWPLHQRDFFRPIFQFFRPGEKSVEVKSLTLGREKMGMVKTRR